MKQYIKELAAISLLIISLLWLLGTAGMSDWDKISFGQCAWRLVIGLTGLGISALWIDRLQGKEKQSGKEN